MQKVLVGVILKPQGIKGELKVRPITDNIERFEKLKTIYIDDIKLKIFNVRICADELFIFIEHVNTRNDAEMYRNKEIFISRDDVEIEEGRYLIDDVVGCDVKFESGKILGKLTDILQYSKVDTYVVDEGKIMFPALDDVVLDIDIVKKVIKLNEKRFKEVAVYDD